MFIESEKTKTKMMKEEESEEQKEGNIRERVTTDTNEGTHQTEWKDDFAFFRRDSCLFIVLWIKQFRSSQQNPSDERQEKNRLCLSRKE